MAGYNKTRHILERIIKYCDDIAAMTERFGKSFESYKADTAYRHACAMCTFQIGELAAKLDDDFREKHDGVPWRKIRGMRNILAHEYETVNNDETWAALETDVPELKAYCESILQDV
jgi:uncharacterized protein with HEPN domain